MIDGHPDPAERLELDATDQLIAELLGDYIARREHSRLVAVHDLAARAADLGPQALTALRFAIAFYETHKPDDHAA